MSNILSKLQLQNIGYKTSDITEPPAPFLCHNWENMEFYSHVIGSVKILTIEDEYES